MAPSAWCPKTERQTMATVGALTAAAFAFFPVTHWCVFWLQGPGKNIDFLTNHLDNSTDRAVVRRATDAEIAAVCSATHSFRPDWLLCCFIRSGHPTDPCTARRCQKHGAQPAPVCQHRSVFAGYHSSYCGISGAGAATKSAGVSAA